MQISLASVRIPDEVLVSFLIPKLYRRKYKAFPIGDQGFFKIKFGDSIVAAVEIKNGFYFIDYLKTAESVEFKSIIEGEYSGNGELFWLVLYPDSINTWTFIGVPEKTKESAMMWVSPQMAEQMCFLVSFLPSERSEDYLRVRSSQHLEGEWPNISASEADMGAVAFQLSPLF